MWGKRKHSTLLVGMKASTTTRKAIRRLLKKLNIDLPYVPAIPLLGIYLDISRGTCTPMFIAALITVDKLWK
jgi:hypothetical protein